MATSRVAPVVPYRFLGLRILGVVILCILSLGVASPWLYLLLLRGPLQGKGGWAGQMQRALALRQWFPVDSLAFEYMGMGFFMSCRVELRLHRCVCCCCGGLSAEAIP